MHRNYFGTAFAAVLGLSVAGISLPAFAEDQIIRNQDCPMNGAGPMDGRGAGRGMGLGAGRGMGMRQGNPRFMARFAILDQNDDGRISDDEAAANREAVFYAMDSDDDQELTEEEFLAVRMGAGRQLNKARMKMRQEAKKARFAPMDTDGSGKVSQAEWMAEGEARFTSADTNGDGIVTPWEFRSRPR